MDPYFSILISLNKKKACCCGVLKILITFKLCSWRNIIKSSFQATVNHVADLGKHSSEFKIECHVFELRVEDSNPFCLCLPLMLAMAMIDRSTKLNLQFSS